MRRPYPLLFIILWTAIPACTNNNSNPVEPKIHAAKSSCPAPDDKAAMYSLAVSIIDKHDNDNIWNLDEIDTTDYAVSENYFTNSKTRNRLVLMNGSAGAFGRISTQASHAFCLSRFIQTDMDGTGWGY